MVTLVRQFDFSLPDDRPEVQKVRSGLIASGLITPVVAGEEHKGPQMPLKVTILGSE